MHYVYLLECSDKTLYCGYTNNLEARLKTHNDGKGAKYTKCRLPVNIVYAQSFETKSEALKKECEIKKLTRQQKLELIGTQNECSNDIAEPLDIKGTLHNNIKLNMVL